MILKYPHHLPDWQTAQKYAEIRRAIGQDALVLSPDHEEYRAGPMETTSFMLGAITIPLIAITTAKMPIVTTEELQHAT